MGVYGVFEGSELRYWEEANLATWEKRMSLLDRSLLVHVA